MKTEKINNVIAAFIGLFVVVSGMVYYTTMHAPIRSEHHFEAVAKRGSDAAAEYLLADKLYKAKAYQESLPYFANYLAVYPDDFKVMLQAGIAHYNAGNIKQAIKLFEVSQMNDTSCFEEASKYLALAKK